jgi:hypothetical protein
MTRYFLMAYGLAALAVPAAMAAGASTPAKLTAAEIADRNVAARGGLEAWRAVSTLTLAGQMEAGGKKNTELPFVIQLKRPHKSRLEIRFQDQTAVQVYDGTQGWKVRPFLGRDEVESFTPTEAKAASAWEDLDGPLVDYVNKGTKIALQGTESVEGHPAYKLKLTMKGGEERHLWVDAASFLELKIEGQPRKMDGKLRHVAVYYRDYKTESGLTVPRVLETVVEDLKGAQPHKLRIERVSANQPMDDALFARPQLALAKPAGHEGSVHETDR